MLSVERTGMDGRPIASCRGRLRGCRLLITGVFSLCAIGSGALAGQADVAEAMGWAGFDAPRLSPPCAPLVADEERVTAIYLDLGISLLLGHDSLRRISKQRWICSDSDLLGVGGSQASSASFIIDLISLDPSALTLTLESGSGEIWQIELASLDDGPLAAAAFASDGAGFFINLVEWSEAGELAILDADFELELPSGESLWGRVLWNATWTPDETPFVPLTDDDWNNAWPGEVSIEGPVLDRLFLSTHLDATQLDATLLDATQLGPAGFGMTAGVALTPKERLDSVRYSREATKGPLAARAEVAADVALLTDPASTTTMAGASRPGPAIPAPAARRPAPATVSRGSAAAEPSPSRSSVLPYSTPSGLPSQYIRGPDSGSWLNQQTSELTRDFAPAGIEDREPWWLDGSDQPIAEGSDPASASQPPGEQAWPDRGGLERRRSAAPEDPSPACATEAIADVGVAGFEASDPGESATDQRSSDWADQARRAAPGDRAGSGSAPEIDPRTLRARYRTGALGHENDAVDPASFERLIDEQWLALRVLWTRWLRAMDAFMMEIRP